MVYKRFLVTGGAGFIGSSFIRYGLQESAECERIVNLDALTYAADLRNLEVVAADPRYLFVQGDIRDNKLVEKLCKEEAIDAIVHFAAESHVDRSIAGPQAFYETNVGGTLALLEVVRQNKHIHFHHISTDEVYGSLTCTGKFSEHSPYQPNSPYAASKAASDHFVRAYAHTYGLISTISHCSNNYGPCQHVEKFIPAMISGCYHKKPLPVYGTGKNVRDWIFVDDHSAAVWAILKKGVPGQTYCIGGESEQTNLDLLYYVIEMFAALCGEDPAALRSLITHVPDRLGHDFRYAIDPAKIKRELHWRPVYNLESGLKATVQWYLNHFQQAELLI